MKVDMCCGKTVLFVVLAFALALASKGYAQDAAPLVPAIITFGDSAVDVGNNNYLATLFKANYPPYGRDFINHQPTGRFCNGKLATDFTADTLGFKTYAPAYLSPQATGKNLLIGANFASAGSGYDDRTSYLNHAISLTQQLQYYREYQSKLAKNMYGLGARKFGVTSLPPLGCLPAARTLFGYHESGCVSRINTDAQQFNKKVSSAATNLQKQLPDLKIVIFDIFKPIYDLVQSPSKSGFVEATRGCCGTGTVETTVFLCNPKSPGTCSNASQYVFWDSVHPSQAANQVIADELIVQGFALL
ncbi:hypothetical protein CISIN_1g018227mg [Citrus sinensis]|uniref:GDSL esterase/lipase APG n=1 Tax=Citrus sinensis TaxID=2711 RepID=A0A067DHM8_CITSI|nr:hypothetical protein CISIN_1g018227mg [Citrus sinensis]